MPLFGPSADEIANAISKRKRKDREDHIRALAQPYGLEVLRFHEDGRVTVSLSGNNLPERSYQGVLIDSSDDKLIRTLFAVVSKNLASHDVVSALKDAVGEQRARFLCRIISRRDI